MRGQIRAMIGSKEADVRKRGWQELRREAEASRARLTNADLRTCEEVLLVEPDPRVYRAAMMTLLHAVLANKQNERQSRRRRRAASLGRWLWRPFKSPSTLFATTSGGYLRRDESALFNLARRLGFTGFPATEIEELPTYDDHWEQVIARQHSQAVCFVGRLGLYGADAVELLGCDEARFGFSQHKRPPRLGRDRLDRDYHHIFEIVDRSKDDRDYYHSEQDDENTYRKDFGLVQRYTAEFDGRRIVVVTIAGASSLGTHAAARWAAYDLFHPFRPGDRRPIPLPEGIGPDSLLEALVECKAELTTRPWERTPIVLHKLFVDRWSWDIERQAWTTSPVRTITVVTRSGQPVRILLDGEPAPLQTGSRYFRLMVAIALDANAIRGKPIDLKRLACDRSIWNGKDKPAEEIDEQKVRRELSVLKCRARLGNSLEIAADVTLTAEVEIREE